MPFSVVLHVSGDAGPGGAGDEAPSRQRVEYLNRVVDDHAGTPWALLAERELSAPMGWGWTEAHRAMTTAGGRGANDPNRVLFVTDPKTGKKKRVMVNKKRPRPPL